MTAEITVPAAGTEFATVSAAVELSLASWLVGIGRPERRTVSRHQVEGGDVAGLVAVLRRAQGEEERRTGRPVRVHVCFEAGRDGHWLHRALTAADFVVSQIDPASIAVDRRARRAKTDRIDVDMLVRTQAALVRGETAVCSVVRVPSVVEEDGKRLHRERERLVAERTSHVNRIRGLLHAQGMRDFHPLRRDRLEQLAALRGWDGKPLPPRLKGELERECRRLALVMEMIVAVEAERDALLDPAIAAPEPQVMRHKMELLAKLKGVGAGFASVLAGEVYYRDFRNRREVGQYTGLAPSPFASGESRREQGISKAGNPRARTALIELAWMWLRYQPDSALAQWFLARVGNQKGRIKRIAIVALARKLAVALWRYVTTGMLPEGAATKAA